MRVKLQQELDRYFVSKNEFTLYHKAMKQILSSRLFNKQLEEILAVLESEEGGKAKSFKLYLDTVIINMQSKIEKYKPSDCFKNEKVKEIENQGYLIPFYCDEADETYILIGIYKKDYLS